LYTILNYKHDTFDYDRRKYNLREFLD